LSFWESPGAIQNLGAGPIEAHRINPALQNGQAVGSFAVGAAELLPGHSVQKNTFPVKSEPNPDDGGVKRHLESHSNEFWLSSTCFHLLCLDLS
jgi:hypothetical protein